MEEVIKRPRRKRSSTAQVAAAAPVLPREAGSRFGRWAVVILLIVAALVATRFWDLGNRSYGHDESIHAWEAWKLVTGQGYSHDPVYHGPFGYHLVALVYMLFGVGEVQARYAPALFSVILVLLVWPMRKWLGKAGSVFAMALLTISPTLMPNMPSAKPCTVSCWR